MQKYPGRPRHLPLSGEREREAAVPHDLSTSSVGGRGDRKGEVPRGPRAPGAPPARAGCWNPPLGNRPLGREDGDRAGVGHSQRCPGLPALHLLPGPSSPRSPGAPKKGWGRLPVAAPGAERRKDPQGSRGKTSLGPQLSPTRRWACRGWRPRAPRGVRTPRNPGGRGRREETRAAED